MRTLSAIMLVLVLAVPAVFAAETESSEAPRLLQFNVVLTGGEAPGLASVVFAVYRDQEGGSPLWSETQNVEVGDGGRARVILGSLNRIPLELFASGDARWLGIQRLPEVEQSRILMAAVPYALKAADADTLGGKPLSAFVLAEPQQSREEHRPGETPSRRVVMIEPGLLAPLPGGRFDRASSALHPVTNAVVATGFQLGSLSGNTSIGFATTGGAWNVYLRPSVSASFQDFDSSQLRMTLSDTGLTVPGGLTLGGNINIASGAAIVKAGFRYLHSVGTASTFVGFKSGTSTNTGANNTGVGEQALGTTTSGFNNVAVGYLALGASTDAFGNTAVGSEAAASLDGAGAGTGHNVFVGYAAGTAMTNGGQNTVIGSAAMFQTTTALDTIALGYAAGFNNTSGSHNIYVGSLGPGSITSESNKIRIGGPFQTATFIAGIRGATSSDGIGVFINSSGQLGTLTSSVRYKDEIEDMSDASDELMKLRPVTFRYKPEIDETGLQQYGLVAEEVAKVDPHLVVYNEDGTPQTVRYHFVNAMLLNEVQKQHRQIEEQQVKLDELAARLAKIEARRD